jgi:hypothetical protein
MENEVENAANLGDAPPNRMPVQVPTDKEQPSVKDYTARKSRH